MYESIAAVISSHIVKHLSVNHIKQVSEKHGASLITNAPNSATVIMGTQLAIDNVKKELAKVSLLPPPLFF